jgi:NADPH:quinone reductase-like Zn-dependent oxidoreductase
MRAVLLRAFGGPEALSLSRDVAVPHAGAYDVLVRVAAVGVNPLDCRVRRRLAWPLFALSRCADARR